MRELKALEIAARSKIVCKGATWFVPSQSSGNKYRVVIEGDVSCECDDFQLRKLSCKHIMACRLVLERDGGETAQVVVSDEVPKKPTYKQNWPLYDLAQETEKNRFQELLFDLCSGIEEPERPTNLRGRKPVPLADQIFACAFKVFSTFSSRRFACDLAETHKKGFMSVPIAARCINGFMEEEKLTPILENLIVQSSLPLRTIETTFAPDSTGFSVSRFVRWFDEKYGETKSGRDWVKAHAMCGVKTNIVTAVQIEDRHTADITQLPGLVKTTAENFTIKDVPADKAYLSHENLELVHKNGGTAFIPFKCNSKENEPDSLWGKMYHFYNFKRDEFLKRYHQRSNIETTFSMVKAKFRDNVRSRTDVSMKNEVLCKFLCHNVCVIHQSIIELGIEGPFWENKPRKKSAVLKYPGVG
jgi:transposase